MLHYTWGIVIKDSFGRKIWEFDKRTYTAEEIQRKVWTSARQRCATPFVWQNCEHNGANVTTPCTQL